jgi:hypothetical protein
VKPGADLGLVGPQAFLAACCVGIGVVPVLAIPVAATTATLLLPGGSSAVEWSQVTGPALALTAFSGGVVLVGALLWAGRRWARSKHPASLSGTWACAYDDRSSRMQYTASSFASPLLAAFGPVAGSREERTAESFRTHPDELVLERMGRPLWNRFRGVAAHLRRIQSGGLRWYLLYVVLCLLGLLLYVRFRALP